jgi:hypothetical protein
MPKAKMNQGDTSQRVLQRRFLFFLLAPQGGEEGGATKGAGMKRAVVGTAKRRGKRAKGKKALGWPRPFASLVGRFFQRKGMKSEQGAGPRARGRRPCFWPLVSSHWSIFLAARFYFSLWDPAGRAAKKEATKKGRGTKRGRDEQQEQEQGEGLASGRLLAPLVGGFSPFSLSFFLCLFSPKGREA